MLDTPWYMRPNDPTVRAATEQLEALHAFEVEAAAIARLLRERHEGDWLAIVDALETNGILHAHVQQRQIQRFRKGVDRDPSVVPRDDAALEELVNPDTPTVLAETLARGGALYDQILNKLVAPRATRGMVMAHRADLRKLRQAFEARVETVTYERFEGHPAAE